MTAQDLIALVEILNRAPTTAAEKLWLQALIAGIEKDINKKRSENVPDNNEEATAS